MPILRHTQSILPSADKSDQEKVLIRNVGGTGRNGSANALFPFVDRYERLAVDLSDVARKHGFR